MAWNIRDKDGKYAGRIEEDKEITFGGVVFGILMFLGIMCAISLMQNGISFKTVVIGYVVILFVIGIIKSIFEKIFKKKD